MVGGEEAEFLLALQRFKEWAVIIATSAHNPDWVMPMDDGGSRAFAFSLDAYNYFASHSITRLKKMENAEELHDLLKKHAERLYKGEGAIKLENSSFFMLPDRIITFGRRLRRAREKIRSTPFKAELHILQLFSD